MSKASRFVTSAVLVLGVLGVTGGAQQQPPATPPAQPATPPADPADAAQPSDQQQPVFRGEVNFVRVDAIVTDKSGKPVLDLKAEDFEITEAGKPQKIETFKVVSLDGGLMTGLGTPPPTIRSDNDEEREAARDDVRLFGLFLDDYHVTRDNSRIARLQIARFVQTQLGPSDMVGLMMPLDPLSAVRMTRNHDAVTRGVEQFEGRKYDYTPKTPAEERWMYTASAETIERMRNEVSIGAIKALIMRMGGLKEGRKALILVSEGYSNTLPPQMRDPIAGQPGFMNPAANDPMAGRDSNAEFRRQAFTGMDMDIYLREVTDLANKNNVSIYAVDPRGLATNEFGIEKNINLETDNQYLRATLETLKMISEDTDGRAIVNNNQLLVGMKQIVVDSSAYYLLGYSSNAGTFDGKFHPINVRVKGRRDLEIRHRAGYWALKPDEAARLNAPVKMTPPSAVEAAIGANAAPRSRLVRTWIGTARGENGKTRVTIAWEPVARVPGQTARESERPARLSVSAVAADGAPLFRGTAPSLPGALPAAGVSQKVTFDVPPGRVQMRLAVEGAGAELLDSETRELTVPDLTAPQLAFGTPEVFRARTTPEFQRIKADPSASPAAGRDFSRTDRLFIRVPVYGPAAAKVSARLLNRGGQSMADIPVTPATETTPATIDVGLTSFAPGDYGIEITAAADGSEVRDLIAFRLVS